MAGVINTMDIKSIRVFVDLAKQLHFSKTAEKHFMSAPTLSRVIQRLEQEIGAPLFQRDNRKVTLTPEGRLFLDYAHDVLQSWQELQQKLNPDAEGLTGEIRIFCSVTASYNFLPQVIDTFRKKHPLVDFHITTGAASDALILLEKDKADVVIAATPEKIESHLAHRPLGEVPLKIIVPKGLKNQWRTLPLIMPEFGLAQTHLNHWLKQVGHSQSIYSTVSGHEALVSMVALGCGLSIAPELIIEQSPVQDKVEALDMPVQPDSFVVGIFCKKRQLKSPLINAFWKNNL